LLGCFCGSLTDEGELIPAYLSGKDIAGQEPGLAGVIGHRHKKREKGLVCPDDRLSDEGRKHRSVIEVEALVDSLSEEKVDDLGAGFAHLIGNPVDFQRYRLLTRTVSGTVGPAVVCFFTRSEFLSKRVYTLALGNVYGWPEAARARTGALLSCRTPCNGRPKNSDRGWFCKVLLLYCGNFVFAIVSWQCFMILFLFE
jgi:hypothetical protein